MKDLYHQPTWTPSVVPFLGLLWILVRIMVRNPQKEVQMGVKEQYEFGEVWGPSTLRGSSGWSVALRRHRRASMRPPNVPLLIALYTPLDGT